jgi:hypothetical protein
MSDTIFRSACLLRLGLTPVRVSDLPTRCFCTASLADDPWHGLSCVKLKRGPITHRHDHIVRTVANWVSSFPRFSVQVEPRVYKPQGQRLKPDLLIKSPSDTQFYLDVTIPFNCAPSHLEKGVYKFGKLAGRMESRKATKYRGFATRHNAKVAGFGIDAFGGWGAGALFVSTWVKREIKAAGRVLPCDWAESLEQFHQQVSCGIQRGNARTIALCLSSASH